MATDTEFLREFEATRWPLDRWHHRDHIRLAYLYLCAHPFDKAAELIRTGIKTHNAAHGIRDTPTSGYHETMTMAWLHLVQVVLTEYGPATDAAEFCDAHPELMEKKVLRLFYSMERFTSTEAKLAFVPPDLTPLPIARRATNAHSRAMNRGPAPLSGPA